MAPDGRGVTIGLMSVRSPSDSILPRTGTALIKMLVFSFSRSISRYLVGVLLSLLVLTFRPLSKNGLYFQRSLQSKKKTIEVKPIYRALSLSFKSTSGSGSKSFFELAEIELELDRAVDSPDDDEPF